MAGDFSSESEKLKSSWRYHDPNWLREYLVSGVEDPRINVQSILSRHFLIQHLFGGEHNHLMEQEYRFAASFQAINRVCRRLADEEDLEIVLHALRHHSDNAEGIPIPGHLLQDFLRLAAATGDQPNYIESFLRNARLESGKWRHHDATLNLFADRWQTALKGKSADRLRVLEVACGSANDYRSWAAYGLASFIHYTGIDLAEANIANARSMFPGVDFRVANAFSLPFEDRSFDLVLTQDLFEHLSFAGMEQAFAEIGRVTRRAICLGFFQMEEIPDHVLRPVEEYHWNLLSLDRVRESWAGRGFDSRALNIGAFMREHTGADAAHNPNAYTLQLWRR